MDFTMQIEGVRSNLVPVRSLSPEDGHYFFGYYDLMPYSPDERRHLACRIPFDGILNTKDDVMEFGYLENGVFTKLLETTCWSFQQANLGQYQFDGGRNIIFYNVFDEEEKAYRTVRYNLDTAKKDTVPTSCGTVSRDGRIGLGINFSRIWDFRPGYGYPNIPDPYADIPSPKEDGIFLCDFDKGTAHLLVDCDSLAKRFPLEGRESAKMVVNHISLNPSGTRYLFLYRSFPEQGGGDVSPRWQTTLFAGDLEGNVDLIFDEMVSHYWWEDDEHMVAFCRPKGERNGVWRVNMVTGKYEELGGEDTEGTLSTVTRRRDIHTSISPDGRFLLGDSYPQADGYRQLFIHELSTGKTRILLETYSPNPDDPKLGIPHGTRDARCDLHARWNRNGTRISLDTVCRGHREILELDMTDFSL
ncbi:MAG: hypothetical protein J6D16_05545 [Clostridia bacterium]|nr:hypothetical protein [Clostridia bacterium]